MSGGSEEEKAQFLREVGEAYAESLERLDHWVDREVRRPDMDEVLLFAHLSNELRKLTPGTVGDAAEMAAAAIIREAKSRKL